MGRVGNDGVIEVGRESAWVGESTSEIERERERERERESERESERERAQEKERDQKKERESHRQEARIPTEVLGAFKRSSLYTCLVGFSSSALGVWRRDCQCMWPSFCQYVRWTNRKLPSWEVLRAPC